MNVLKVLRLSGSAMSSTTLTDQCKAKKILFFALCILLMSLSDQINKANSYPTKNSLTNISTFEMSMCMLTEARAYFYALELLQACKIGRITTVVGFTHSHGAYKLPVP